MAVCWEWWYPKYPKITQFWSRFAKSTSTKHSSWLNKKKSSKSRNIGVSQISRILFCLGHPNMTRQSPFTTQDRGTKGPFAYKSKKTVATRCQTPSHNGNRLPRSHASSTESTDTVQIQKSGLQTWSSTQTQQNQNTCWCFHSFRNSGETSAPPRNWKTPNQSKSRVLKSIHPW